MKHIKTLSLMILFFAISFIVLAKNVYAVSVVKAACYCCGGSQGCTYIWKEANETVGDNCVKDTVKLKTNCNGSATASGTGACWYCDQGSQGLVYKWTSDGVSPGYNCYQVNGMGKAACSGVPETDYGDDDDSTSTDDDNEYHEDEETDGPDAILTTGEATCSGILGNTKFHQYLVDILNAIRIIGVAMVIVFSTMDFTKALIAQDSEALKKASQTSFKRLMIAIVIFFVPIILNILLSLVGISGICI